MGRFDRRILRRRHAHPLRLPYIRAFVRLQEPRGRIPTFCDYVILLNFFLLGFFDGDFDDFFMMAGAKISDWSDTDGTMLWC